MDKSQVKKIFTTLTMLLSIIIIGYVILICFYGKYKNNNIKWQVPSTLNYKPTSLFPFWDSSQKQKENKKGRRIDVMSVPLHRAYNPVHTVPDKFEDLVLNNVNVGDQANRDILNYYNCYFNNNTRNNLLTGSNMANTNYINNSEKIVTQLNTLSGNIDELMVQLNNDILNNIGDNYHRAHLLNKQREEMKKTLYELPLKNI